jgi:hypothetical protein
MVREACWSVITPTDREMNPSSVSNGGGAYGSIESGKWGPQVLRCTFVLLFLFFLSLCLSPSCLLL